MANEIDSANSTWCDGCTYVEYAEGKITEAQAEITQAASAPAWPEDANIAARKNRALGELTDAVTLERLVCDPTKGCRFAQYCIDQAIAAKQREPFRR